MIPYERRRAESEKEEEDVEDAISVVFQTFFGEDERKPSDELFCPREVNANPEWLSHGR